MSRARATIAAFLICAAILIVTPAARAIDNLNGFDDFDSYQAGLLPGDNQDGLTDFYNYFDNAGVACRVTNAEASSTPNSLQFIDNGVCAGHFDFYESLCLHPELHVKFKFSLSALPAAGKFAAIGIKDGNGEIGIAPTGGTHAGMRIDENGLVEAYSGSTVGSSIPSFNVVIDTWYQGDIYGVGCDGTSQMFVAVIGEGTASVVDPTLAPAVEPTYYTLAAGGTDVSAFKIFIDDLQVQGAATIAAAATVCKNAAGCGNEIAAWTGDLVGFDVDDFGNVVIARTQESASVGNVRALNPTSLAQIGTGSIDTECNRPDGVMAYSQYPPGQFYTAFTQCTVAATTVNTFSIRSGSLGDPSYVDTACEDFCEGGSNNWNYGDSGENISCESVGDSALPATPTDIGNVASIPISFNTSVNPSSSQPRNAHIGFAYNDPTGGNVGFWVRKLINNNPDRSCVAELPFAPPGTTVQSFCTIRYLNQTLNPQGDFIGAMSFGNGGKFWSTRITNLDDASQSTYPSLEMNAVGPTLPNNNGMACSGTNDVLTLSSTGQVIRWHIFAGEDRTRPTYDTEGVPHYPFTATPGAAAWSFSSGYSPPSNGIEMDHTGNWGVYLSSATKATVINATTGTAVAIVTLPSGTYDSMRLTRNGQNLYIATTTHIARYEIYSATTVVPLCPVCNPDGSIQNSDGTTTTTSPPGSGTGGGGGGNLVGALITPFLGDLGTTGTLLLGFLIIVLFVGIGALITRRKAQA